MGKNAVNIGQHYKSFQVCFLVIVIAFLVVYLMVRRTNKLIQMTNEFININV